MRVPTSIQRSFARVLVLLALAACSDATGPENDAVGVVTVFAPQNELVIGGTVQLVATVLNETGVAVSNQQVTWSTSNPAVATVTTGGLVMALAGGTTEIRASAGGRSGSASIRVQAAPCQATASSSRTIAPGDSRSGELDPSDCLFIHGISAEGWQLSLTERMTLQIDLSSSRFSPVVVITDRQLNIIGWADAEAGGVARLVSPVAAGNYIVWVTSFSDQPSGAYQLSIQVTETGSCTTPAGTLSVGQGVTGTLASSDCMLESGHLVDFWTLEFSTATRVQINLSSTMFDTFLIVTDPDWNWIVADDDGGDGLNSQLVYTFPAGRYLVWATSYGPGATGSYQLSVLAAGSTSRLPHDSDGITGGRLEREPARGKAAAMEPRSGGGATLESLLARYTAVQAEQ